MSPKARGQRASERPSDSANRMKVSALTIAAPPGIVVEVDERVLAGVPGVGDPFGPGPQRTVAIVRPRIRPALVQPQVAPVGGAPQRGDRPAQSIGPAQRGAMLGEYGTHLVGPPRVVPRFDRHPHGRREAAETLREQRRVATERRRELEQHGAQPITQPGRAVEQPGHRFGRLTQPPDVGEVPAGLHGHHEVGRGPAAPLREHLPTRQPVEGVVHLDRAEPGRVVLEPEPLGNAGRIEPAAPVGVLPTGRADLERHRATLTPPGLPVAAS